MKPEQPVSNAAGPAGGDGEDRAEGAELCLCCLGETRPAANFCHRCGAPQGFLATALPYQKILAEGFFHRRAIQDPRNRVTVIGVWLVFGQMALGGCWMTWQLLGLGSPGLLFRDGSLLGALAWSVTTGAIGVAGLVQVTLNYYKRRR